MQNEQNAAPTPQTTNPDQYPVYPEPDGYDRPVNPYGQH